MHRDFKGIWIDKNIWLNKDLTVMEKLFLVEIDSLDNENGCYASNAHFSNFFDLSKARCTQIIKSLEAKKMITIVIERDGKIISKRVIRILNTLVNKLNTPSKKTKHPYLENAQGINTITNNTNIEKGDQDFLNKKYSKKEFLEDWNYLRKEHLNKPSFLNSLSRDETSDFEDLNKNYSRDDFQNALIGLFKQKKLPNNNSSMQSNPKHFLTHINSYLTAYHDKNMSLYGNINQD